MKKIYTISAVASKEGKNIISTCETLTTLTEARNSIFKASDKLRKAGYTETKIILLKNGQFWQSFIALASVQAWQLCRVVYWAVIMGFLCVGYSPLARAMAARACLIASADFWMWAV